jgi:hypothetical protein
MAMTPVGDRLIQFNLIRGSNLEGVMLYAARASEGNIAFVAILGFLALAALIAYLPKALHREATRSEDEVLPEWMGTVKERRARLRVIFAVLGGLGVGFAAVVMFGK